MEHIKELLANPLAWTGICIGLGLLLRILKIAKHWKQLGCLICAVIEVFDKRVHNILNPEQEKKLGRIKKIIARTLTARQKKDIDNLLGGMKIKGAGELDIGEETTREASNEAMKLLKQ